MPELPDIELYVGKIAEMLIGQPLLAIRVFNPFVLRSFSPPLTEFAGKHLVTVERLGKRIVLGFEEGLFLVIHLMIAGRFQWKAGAMPAKSAGKITHAILQFPYGGLILTEASSKKRASIYAVRGADAVAAHDPGGIEPLTASLDEFQVALQRENRTLKRALTNPHAFSGIGNAYSDEILHAARLTPVRLTCSLTPQEIERLWKATQETLSLWRDKLKDEFKNKFPGPGDVTAFRPDFAVHGKYRKPCPVCGKPVQHIVYAANEVNYCAQCQNEGRLLADRSLSRLLKGDWPKTLEELEG